VLALQTLVSREINAQHAAVISVSNLNAGSGSFNVLPEVATLSGTVRTFEPSVRDLIEARMFHLCAGLETATGIQMHLKYTRLTDVVHNHPKCTETSRIAAKAVVGSERVEDFAPIMGGEDFGGFLKSRPGAFVIVGQRENSEPSSPHNYGLHSPRYDFNDAIIPLVVRYLAEIAENCLSGSDHA
jgi:hippurate hydrolase